MLFMMMIFANGLVLSVLYFGGSLVINHEITIGQLTSYVLYTKYTNIMHLRSCNTNVVKLSSRPLFVAVLPSCACLCMGMVTSPL